MSNNIIINYDFVGMLIYKKENNILKLLILQTMGKYEDIGLKINDNIINILYLAQHIENETNGLIKILDIIERLKKAPLLHLPKSKNIIYFIEANDIEKKLKKEHFDNHSHYNGLIRYIGWVSCNNLFNIYTLKYKVNQRIQSKTIYNKLLDIDMQNKYKKRLFKN